MRFLASAVVAVGCCLLFSGCKDSSSDPTASDPRDAPLESQIVGEWTTGTAPEMESSQTTLIFRDSGEFNMQWQLVVFGKPVTVEHEGRKLFVRANAVGSWNLQGDQLTARVTHTDQPSVTITEPIKWKVVSCTQKKLELQVEDGEFVAYFRKE